MSPDPTRGRRRSETVLLAAYADVVARPTCASAFSYRLVCTVRVRSDVPSLRTLRVMREVERSFRVGCARPGFRLVHYSLQSNHAHLVVEARDRAALGPGMMAIGARTWLLATGWRRHGLLDPADVPG